MAHPFWLLKHWVTVSMFLCMLIFFPVWAWLPVYATALWLTSWFSAPHEGLVPSAELWSAAVSFHRGPVAHIRVWRLQLIHGLSCAQLGFPLFSILLQELLCHYHSRITEAIFRPPKWNLFSVSCCAAWINVRVWRGSFCLWFAFTVVYLLLRD